MSRSRGETWRSNRFPRDRMSRDAVEKVLSGRNYLAFITFVTIYSLIGDQIRVAVLPPSSDVVFKYFNTLVFFIFVLEVCLMAATTDKYFLDLSSAAKKARRRRSSTHWTVAASSRYKSMGIKPSFYFVMDVLSTLMLIFDPTYVSFISIASESSGNNGAWRASKASRLSAKAVRIIRILRLTSFMRLVKFQVTTGAVRTPDTMGHEPESGDHQPFSFLKRPGGLARARSPSALIIGATGGGEGGAMSPVPPPKHKESRLGAAVSESNHRKVIIGCLLLLSAAPLLNYSAIDNSWNFALGLCADVAGRGDNSLTRAVASLVATAAGGVGRLEANGVVYYNDPKKLDHLRRNEIATYTYNGAQAKQSLKQMSSQTAWENVGMVAVVLVLFLSLSLALQADLSRLVLQPLRQMMDLVECISNNPLAPIQESMLGSQEKQGLEPTMLLQTIGKIGSLVKIGLGEAGADIISRSLRDSHNFKLDLVNGKLVKGVFVFCDIRNFTDTTECLQEEVMVFVNKIACILHSVTTQCNGAPNKNVGDAFLLVWNIQERGDVDAAGSPAGGQAGMDNLPVFSPGGNRTLAQTGSQADKALYAVLKFTCEMIRRSSFVCQFSSNAAQRLYHRMPNYRVGIGFGLHMGWAVEGPIGSDQKIDVSYISPHVSMSEWLQDLTKEYGCGVLLSDQVYRLLSSPAQYVCRQIDCIRRSDINQNEEPFNIYTYDCDLDAMYKQVEIEQQGPEAPRTAASRPIKRTSGNEMSLTPKMMSEWTGASGAEGSKTTRYQGGADLLKVEVKPYNTLVWESDTDLQTLRSMAPPAFRTTWNFAMSSYLAGEWGSAKQGFETALEISQGRDKASQRLLSILAASGDKAPPGWPGYREVH